ncbi:MAG TPA: flagellar hook-basal body complex protein FliE [Candidatus Sulfotelmatobacter sp.]|jgi:flagellar hook-basal body complex protein FliE|nr:flagellar hook-basal body complex protein FliE [Candidatus Sulfotelmatobacter sp.]
MNGAIPSSSLRILPADAGISAPDTSASSQPDFRELLSSAVDDIQQLGTQAEAKVSGVLEGNGSDVHTALIAVEKADLTFQLMMQVRNKIVSAYEEISRMQF